MVFLGPSAPDFMAQLFFSDHYKFRNFKESSQGNFKRLLEQFCRESITSLADYNADSEEPWEVQLGKELLFASQFYRVKSTSLFEPNKRRRRVEDCLVV